MQSRCHTIHAHHEHLTWCRDHAPVMTVAPGDTLEYGEMDAVCGQLSRHSTAEDIANLDFARVNPIVGPVYVDGAEPGDALKITLLGFNPSGWGWTGIIPGFGLLADDFPDPGLHIWTYDRSLGTPTAFSSIAKIPVRPFCGIVGVEQAAAGEFSTVPPYATGGNLDTRDLTVGVELYLPVQVPGALFSLGDPHCAQGDGEVCGTAIESPMGATVKLDLVKGENLRFPRFVTHEPVTRHIDSRGYEATMGIGPDLMEASRNAVRGMIDRLTRLHKMSAADAYMLCSVAGDLRISEIVDMPNVVVSFYMPRQIFE
ncbi:acetamidase/formamidase family protein [Sphingomonas oryzagri]|jgi:acetamidase/formamidase|uniref:Acetamidase/formamidase family protein n=1 Tax=Sphingomonas oryzagri TaxID=3042314 RepID=A0ABT6N053_9SPHN|nr:acetamidase/formamidase family protein [Sphingomonas oryzagri]MDH7637701.1 acetamidase/formamidase family protein [Sphingomonas oryzagri]